MFQTEIIVKGITYKYFGGHRTRQLARWQANSLREQGHLAAVRPNPAGHSLWIVYWHDRSPKRQNIRW